MKSYRGWSVVPQEAIQTNYDVARPAGTRRPKTRRFRGYLLTGPDGTVKFVDNLAHARRYIDNYEGSSGASRRRGVRRGTKRNARGRFTRARR